MTEDALDEAGRRRPRRWLAVVLSLVWPGLGHAYAGELLRGLVLVAVIAFVVQPVVAVLGSTATLAALVAVLAAGLVIAIVVAVDAARIATRVRRRRSSRTVIVLGCIGFAVVSIVVDTAGKWARDAWIVSAYRVASGAMMPTLVVGDHLYSDPRAYSKQEPARGDVIVFRVALDHSRVLPLDRNPELPAELFIKRVVGVPGDRVEFDGAELHVNGEPKTGAGSSDRLVTPGGEALTLRPEALGEAAYRVADDPERHGLSADEIVVEPDRFFVAGDNRDYSNDSRYWGTVHRDDIVGRVTSVYWSWDFNGPWTGLLDPSHWATLLSERTRWDRIGQRVN